MSHANRAYVIGICLMLFGFDRTVRFFTKIGWIRCHEDDAIWLR